MTGKLLNNNLFRLLFLLVSMSAFFTTGCNDSISFEEKGGELVFSSDTLMFDTVFSSIGSVTYSLSVRNPYSKSINISSIALAGENSFFRLNIDGYASNHQEDIEVRKNDSLYIFVEVTVDPSNSDNPLLIEDSIAFELNGQKSYVILQAYGQDVNLLHGAVITSPTVWTANKPYLIYDSLWVAENATLSIEEGTTVYCHKGAVISFEGNVVANGSVEKPIVFRGDRLDYIWEGYKYDYNSALWGGIDIYPTDKAHVFNNVNIRNSVVGLCAPVISETSTTKLKMQNTTIHNNSYAGLYLCNTELEAYNCQLTNAGYYNVYFLGGSYDLKHCTLANYYDTDSKREDGDNGSIPCLSIIDYHVLDDSSLYYIPFEKCNFENSVIDGSFDSELSMSFYGDIVFMFNNCAVRFDKSIEEQLPDHFKSVTYIDEPEYKSVARWNFDFCPDSLSPLRDVADLSLNEGIPELAYDIRGVSRTSDLKPDLGAFEYVPSDSVAEKSGSVVGVLKPASASDIATFKRRVANANVRAASR